MREKMPDIAISSDIIVGFPGETEEDFEDTLDAVRHAQFDFIYSFIYSPRVGTPAAKLEDTTPHEVKTERFARLLEVQNAISRAKTKGLFGQRLRLLVEGPSKNQPRSFQRTQLSRQTRAFYGRRRVADRQIRLGRDHRRRCVYTDRQICRCLTTPAGKR